MTNALTIGDGDVPVGPVCLVCPMGPPAGPICPSLVCPGPMPAPGPTAEGCCWGPVVAVGPV